MVTPNIYAICCEALLLFNLGLNVFPQPYGQKSGLPWKRLQYTRLPEDRFVEFFSEPSNVAVMVGRTSRNLFVIDAETPQAFAYHCSMFRERGIPLWAVKTARGGHIWVYCSDGVVSSMQFQEENFEVQGSSGYVLAPPSLHPNGIVYTWLHREGPEPPTVPLSQIDWIPLKLDGRRVRKRASDQTQADSARDDRFSRLSVKTQKYLECPEDNSTLDNLYAAACDLFSRGFSWQEASTMLPMGMYEPSQAHRTLSNAYKNTPVRVNISFDLILDYIELYIHSLDWSGRGGTSMKKVALALLERARQERRNYFRASIRELAQISRLSINSVGKALDGLQSKYRLIFKSRFPDEMSGASRWYFSDMAYREGKKLYDKVDTLHLSRRRVSSVSILYTNPENATDAAEWGALGANGILVYEELRRYPEPVTVKKLAGETRLSESQVRYALRKLVGYQLAHKMKRAWVAVMPEVDARQLDELVARPAGKLGRGSAREKAFRRERQAWAAQPLLKAGLQVKSE